jgi:hypothetical protein
MGWSRLPLKPNRISKIQEISIYWIVIGIIEFILGINGYVRYSKNILQFIPFPEQIELKNIFFGTISILIGIRIIFFGIYQPKLIFSFPIWILMFVIAGVIQYYIDRKDFGFIYVLIADYIYIILSVVTIKILEKENKIQRFNWMLFLRTNRVYVFFYGFVLISMIFILGEIFRYSYFY